MSDFVDYCTNCTKTIDVEHFHIHEGLHFEYSDSITLNSGSEQTYVIEVPDLLPSNLRYHMNFSLLKGSKITEFLLYKQTDRVGTTLQQNIFNSNDNFSADESKLKIYKGSSGGTTDGILRRRFKDGSGFAVSAEPSTSRNKREIILLDSSKYLLKIISSSNDNLINIPLTWYIVRPCLE